MCEIEVDEVCDVWRETTVRARKSHTCTCCGGPIRVGEEYINHWSLFDGASYPGKLCGGCAADRDEFSSEHGGVVPHPSGVIDMVNNCIHDGYGDDGEEQRWGPMLERIKARGAVLV